MATTRSAIQKLLSPKARKVSGFDMLDNIPLIKCADGLTLSVQASRHHYCTPRDNAGPWKSVEVGFPSKRVEEFMPYMDGAYSDPTDTVYGWVPLKIVAAVIDAHGGIA